MNNKYLYEKILWFSYKKKFPLNDQNSVTLFFPEQHF